MILCINSLEIALGYPIFNLRKDITLKEKEIACISMSLAFLLTWFFPYGQKYVSH